MLSDLCGEMLLKTASDFIKFHTRCQVGGIEELTPETRNLSRLLFNFLGYQGVHGDGSDEHDAFGKSLPVGWYP